MIDTRNVAVHEYHRLDAEILWTTATENLPPLDQQLAAIERLNEATRRDIRRAERARSTNTILQIWGERTDPPKTLRRHART
jgi:ribonuclease HepT-like protein